jgi:3-dehydroquinate dehydratase
MKTRVCVSISGRTLEEMRWKAERALGMGADLVEFRLDLLRAYEYAGVAEHLGRFSSRSIIKLEDPEEARRILSHTSPLYLDLLLERLKQSGGADLDKGSMVITSWHDFHSTPGEEKLLSLAREASAYGIPKIVTRAERLTDNYIVLSLYRKVRTPLIAFCMGELGVLSRILSISLGSPIMYSCLPGEELAEGQPDVRTTLLFRRLIS